MKKIYTLIAAMLMGTGAFCQCSVTVSGQTNVTCNGNCNGGATITTVGTPPFTYLWSPGGQTVQNPTTLCAGVNTVTLTDASSCQATDSVDIIQPAVLDGFTMQVNVSCNGDSDGSINLTPTGGTPTYAYLWFPTGETTQDISALGAGTYTVTITDNNNCTDTITATITEPLALNVAVTAFTGCGAACDKSGIAAPNGGTTPYTYSWSTTPVQTTATATGLCAGSFLVNVTDFNGCTAAGGVTIFNPTPLSATETHVNVLCFGGSTGTATGTGADGTPNYTYSWNTTPAQSTQTATGLAAGTYTCTVTDANGCTVTVNAIITQPSIALSATETHVNVLCFGGSTGTATGTGADGTPNYNYSWNTTPAQTTQTATGLAAGTYTCTVTDSNGCTATVDATVTQPSVALTAITTATDATAPGCCNGSASTTASGGTSPYAYLWSPGGQTTSTATALCADSFTVTVTDTNGCTFANTAIVNCVSGIAQNDAETDFYIFPNPNTGVFDVMLSSSANGDYTIELSNVLGQNVYNEELKSFSGKYTKKIDITLFGKGIYLLNLKNNDKQLLRKVIVY